MNALQSPKALKLVNKLIDDVQHNGIITNTVVADLKALRPYTIQEELPLLAKATRLAAEHIEENETFDIPMPSDEPIEDEEGNIIEDVDAVESTPEASLHYFFCLLRDIDKKVNEEEMRDYVKGLKEY